MPLFLLVIAVTSPMPISIVTTDDALSLFANPAGLGNNNALEFNYLYNFQPGSFFNNSTFLVAIGQLAGFVEPLPLRYGVGWGGRKGPFLGGVRIVADTTVNCDLGVIIRPEKRLSLGGIWQSVNHKWGRPGIGMGLRPIGPRLTIYGETYINPVQYLLGFQTQPVRGIELNGRVQVDKNPSFSFGINAGLGNIGFGVTGCSSPSEVAGSFRISSKPQPALIPLPKQYLKLKISEPIVEQKPGLSLTGMSKATTGYALLNIIKKAADNDNIRGLLIKLENEAFDFSFAGELRAALIDFRSRNKKVIVYAQSLGMVGYYISSAADWIVLNPMGDLIIPGFSIQSKFFKGILDKLNLKVSVNRHGKYKSAVEVFTQDSMSAENREQLMSLLEGLYKEFLGTVSVSRNLTNAELEEFINKGFFRAEFAKQNRLVDTLLYEDQLDSLVKIYFPGLRLVDEKQFISQQISDKQWGQLPEIAVIYILGNIIPGESSTDFLTGEYRTGAKTICRVLKEAASKKQIKGIVIRINSPGGDAVASELIWREISKIRGKKPVVVSMGEMAASGGYFVACNADRIFAQPSTITGSIGVFSLKLITEGLYNKLGIRRQIIKKGEHADALTDYRELTPEEDSILQEQIDWFYQHFVHRVAQGRNMSSEQVDSIAQGRIWLGIDAKQIGLVDSLGGLMPAIEYCRQMAKLGNDYQLVFYPKHRTGLGALIKGTKLLWEILVK